MLARVAKRTTTQHASDEQLAQRAHELNAKYLDSRATVGSIRWVSNQNTRWGSTTLATGDIRISDRLQKVPDYVLDSVIIHELTHTFIPGHPKEFWNWADRAPKQSAQRATLRPSRALVTSKKINYFSSESEPESKSESDSPSFVFILGGCVCI